MMDGWDHGLGAGWWVFMSLLWVLLIAVIVWAAAQLFPGRRETRQGERPEDVLDLRLARGEIDLRTYDRLKARLRGGAAA